MTQPLLQVKELGVSLGRTAPVHAVLDCSLEVDAGERVALIGESGSGKTVASLAMLRLLDPKATRIWQDSCVRFDGRDLLGMNERELRRTRSREIGLISQNPMTCLNPTIRIGDQISFLLRNRDRVSKAEARERTLAVLEEVELPNPIRISRSYPHELSGGMRQRALIASALVRDPRLIIADEPTSALDTTVQAALLEMLRERLVDRGTSLLMISHDLGMVSEFCERIYVMYGGRIVEHGDADVVLSHPQHPYTRALAGCVPSIDGTPPDRLQMIRGRQTTRREIPQGCVFADRCDVALSRCRTARPALTPTEVGTTAACVHIPGVTFHQDQESES